MEKKLKKSEKKGTYKSGRSLPNSPYSRRRKTNRDLNQYEQDKVTNAEPEDESRVYESLQPDEFDVEHEEEREKRRKTEEVRPPDEATIEDEKN